MSVWSRSLRWDPWLATRRSSIGRGERQNETHCHSLSIDHDENDEQVHGSSIGEKDGKSPEEIEMLAMLKDGGDFVSEDHLEPLMAWYKAQ